MGRFVVLKLEGVRIEVKVPAQAELERGTLSD